MNGSSPRFTSRIFSLRCLRLLGESGSILSMPKTTQSEATDGLSKFSME
ncbi:MAG: hypothetical protein NC205_05485 [Prevotella sp.]|nr:hypothetical protein [Alistipes senegalensis]MCM1358027.1 hypothetical protein [Prevotella sp.]MCM1473001.1 hypothetical protein [Muribaculaceae bacterium]